MCAVSVSWCRFADMILVFSSSVFACFGKFELRLNKKSNRRFRFMDEQKRDVLRNNYAWKYLCIAEYTGNATVFVSFIFRAYERKNRVRAHTNSSKYYVRIEFLTQKKHDHTPRDIQPTCPLLPAGFCKSINSQCLRRPMYWIAFYCVFGYSNGFIFRQ